VQPSKSRLRAEKYPLIEVSKGNNKKEALAGLAAWKKKHPKIAKLLEPADVLVDQMRGRSSAWYRIRINLQHVPEKLRPRPRTPSRARKRA
jgi:bifunctional non-homologous end joining protein LigD